MCFYYFMGVNNYSNVTKPSRMISFFFLLRRPDVVLQ